MKSYASDPVPPALLELVGSGVGCTADSELREEVYVVVGLDLAGTQHLVVLTDLVAVFAQLSDEIEVAVLCATSGEGKVSGFITKERHCES